MQANRNEFLLFFTFSGHLLMNIFANILQAYKFARRIEPEMPPLADSSADAAACTRPVRMLGKHEHAKGPLPPSGLSPRLTESNRVVPEEFVCHNFVS